MWYAHRQFGICQEASGARRASNLSHTEGSSAASSLPSADPDYRLALRLHEEELELACGIEPAEYLSSCEDHEDVIEIVQPSTKGGEPQHATKEARQVSSLRNSCSGVNLSVSM